MFTNTKREKKNSKFIFTKHMVKRDVDIIIRMFNFKVRNNRRDKRNIGRVRKRRERFKKSSKTTFNRFKINERKIVF